MTMIFRGHIEHIAAAKTTSGEVRLRIYIEAERSCAPIDIDAKPGEADHYRPGMAVEFRVMPAAQQTGDLVDLAPCHMLADGGQTAIANPKLEVYEDQSTGSVEGDMALALAHTILELKYEDPDSDRCILARQLIRARNAEAIANRALATEKKKVQDFMSCGKGGEKLPAGWIDEVPFAEGFPHEPDVNIITGERNERG